MPTRPTGSPTTKLSPAEVETKIAELLARDLGVDVATFLRDLGDDGVDSIGVVEILCDLETHFGVRLPEDRVTAACLRSIPALARRVCEIGVIRQKVGA